MATLSVWLLQNKGYVRQLLVSCSVSILPFIYGLLETWPSLAIKKISEDEAGFPVIQDDISIIVTMPTFAEFLVPIIFGFIMVKFGRKTNLLLNAVVYIVAWVLITFARSPVYLMVANFACGFGGAILLIIGPIYIAEIADKNKRGELISIYVTAVSIGQIFLTSVGIFISYYLLNLISLILAVLALFFIVAFATESPYWHLMSNDDKKAEKSFKYFWNTNSDERNMEVSTALAELKEVVESEMKSACSYMELFRTPSNVRASVIVIALSVFQGACGVIAIFTYASTTLPEYDGFWQPNPTIAIVSVLNLVTNVISVGLIDRLGRKPLTIISNAGDAVGTAIVTIYFFIDEYTTWGTNNIKWLPYIGVLIFISFYGFAMATIPHLLAGELFPANVRYHASVVSVCCFAGSSAFFNYIYLSVCQYAGVSVMFLIFTLFSFAATLFSCCYMFETKNLSLAEIQMKTTGRK